MTVLIAGAGIAGLSLGLTLHQIGVPFRIFESVSVLRPLGVGINLQPNAVRELFELWLEADLERTGVRTRDYGFYTRTGLEIWTEPRGTWAGYRWPQYSIHRGRLQGLLLQRMVERAGPAAVATGVRAVGFRNRPDAVTLTIETEAGREEVEGSLLVGADGIHSAIRAWMHPEEGPPIWSGRVMWRGVTRARPFLSGASMILAGHDTQRFVAYPISGPDADDGLADINWIAELAVDPKSTWAKEDWNRAATLEDFLPAFEDWRFGWLDVPELVMGAGEVLEYPMVDRDPVDRWTEGRVTLMGDAAHPTYPVGSNGASQAIVDARVIGQKLIEFGVAPQALAAYEAEVRPKANKVVLANRDSGPDAIMQLVEDRSGGVFERIEDVVPRAELEAHAARYKRLAGFSVEELNARPPTIDPDARMAEA